MKLDPPVAVCGNGVVLPQTQLQRVASRAGREYAVWRVAAQQAALARWLNEPRARRASPITLYMLEAGRLALATASVAVNPATLGIVAAFHTGVIIPTRRFFEGLVNDGPRFASPNLFPETVFNSPTSHVAAVLGATGPCYSVVGDASAWVSAIAVAACWLANGSVEHALVLGAEEFDALELDAYVAARWLRAEGRFVPSEGAGAVLLRRAADDDPVRVTALAEGFTYRTAAGARTAAEQLYAEFAGVPTVCRAAQHNWLAPVEAELHHRLGLTEVSLSPDRGEAFVATAAWHTVWAADRVRATPQALLVPVWGPTEQCSALLLEGPSL